jgi:hypothetical protein
MHSDLATARHHLEAAFDCLSGNDEFSHLARNTISMMLDSVLTIEHRPTGATIIPFPVAKPTMERGRNRTG